MKALSGRTLGHSRPGVLFCLLQVLLTLPAWADGRIHIVKIEGMKFTPETLAVHKGDKITWENHDLVPHTVTSVAGKGEKVESGSIEPGKSFTLKAPRTRNLSYYCRFHPLMKGAITTVQEKL